MKDRSLLIINPISGGKNQSYENRLQAAINRYPGLDTIKTEYPGHAGKIAEHTLDKYDRYVVAGGDGTINEVATVIVNTDKRLAIIPRGSANGLAFHHKIPFDLDPAFKTALGASFRKIDVIACENRFIVNCGGVGFDGYVNKLFNTTKARGLWSYARLIFSEFMKFKEFPFELEIDGKKETGKAFVIVLANTKQYGHDFLFAPNASTEDGVMQLSLIKKPPFLSIPYLLYKVKKGRISELKYFHERSGQKILIKSASQLVHFDGEQFSSENEGSMQLEVLPKALNLVC